MERDTQFNINSTKEQLYKLYDKEDSLQKEIKLLLKTLEQLREDIEVTELIFMHQTNKLNRGKEWKH